MNKAPILRSMGHAIYGEGFSYLDFEEDELDVEVESNGAVISFKKNPLSLQDLDAELHNLVEGTWDWKVTQTLPDSFEVTFPSRAILLMSAHSGRLFPPLNGSEADIWLADAHPVTRD
jgi:hypothetical protein